MFKQRVGPRHRFIIAKLSSDTLEGQSKEAYRKNVEKAVIASLLLTIFAFRFVAHFDFERYFEKPESVTLEFIDIPEIPPAVAEPPKMKMENVVQVEPEKEQTEEESELAEQVEDLLNENDEEVQLALANEGISDYLLSSSPMGQLSGPQLRLREDRSYRGGGLDLHSGDGMGDLAGAGDLDIGTTVHDAGRDLAANDDVNLDITKATADKGVPDGGGRGEEEVKLGLSGKVERIITFSSSTIGTDDYKLWNKIISELDRLNKGRYGEVPDAIQRNKRGFVIHFRFADGTEQEVHWRRDGNIWIKVIGQSNKTNIQELRRSLNRLLRL